MTSLSMKLPAALESVRAKRTWDNSERFNSKFNLRNRYWGEIVGLTGREVGMLVAPSVLTGL